MSLEAINDPRYQDIIDLAGRQLDGYTSNLSGGTSVSMSEIEIALQAATPGPFSQEAIERFISVDSQVAHEQRRRSALLRYAVVLGIITRRYANGAEDKLEDYFPSGTEQGIEKLRNVLNTTFASDPYVWSTRAWNKCSEELVNSDNQEIYKDIMRFWTRERGGNGLSVLSPKTRIMFQLTGVFNVRFNPKKEINTSLSLPMAFEILFCDQRQIGILEWCEGEAREENMIRIGCMMAAVDAHRAKILKEGWWKEQERTYGFMTTGYKQSKNFSGISYSRVLFGNKKVEPLEHIQVDDAERKSGIYKEVSRFSRDINQRSSKERFLEVKRIKEKNETPSIIPIWSE